MREIFWRGFECGGACSFSVGFRPLRRQPRQFQSPFQRGLLERSPRLVRRDYDHRPDHNFFDNVLRSGQRTERKRRR